MKFVQKVSKYIMSHEEERLLRRVLEIATFDTINNKAISGNRIIAVMPTIHPHAGGTTSALRILNYLSQNGYVVDVLCYDNDNVNEMLSNAKINVQGFGGTFVSRDIAMKNNYDVCIATNWISVYYAKKLSGYKFYFVQDYEPFFTEIGDQSCLAKKTYELGFHIISLGQWNVEQIKQHCNTVSKIDSIDFPFEPKEYPYRKRDYSNYSSKKKIRLAIYTRRVGRRIPVITQHIIMNLGNELAKLGIELEPIFYGLNPKDKVFYGKNAGKLNKKELLDLYYNSDFGMVASITNISLVPMEMHSSGLPLIEFYDGSYREFLGDNTAILIDYDYNTLLNKLLYYLEHPDELKSMNEKARSAFQHCTWNNTCEQFKRIVDAISQGISQNED